MPQALPAIGTFLGGAAAAKMAFDPKSGKQTVTQQVDPAQQAMYEDLYGRAKGIAAQPFVPYTGARVAGFNPDQLRQFQATRGLFETGIGYDPFTGLQQLAEQPTPTVQQITPYQAPTIGGIQAPTAAQIGGVQAPQFRSLLGADIAAYQSPYQQQVIDVALGDIQRQADIAQQQAQERSIRAGAFGGSRSALLEAEAARPYAEQAARTVAGLRQAGFEQAQRAAESDIARQQQLGMFGAEQAQQRALQQAQLQQQAGLTGYEGALQTAQQQAQLAQQAGLAGQDIQARMAQFTPQFQLQAQAQQAGLLGDIQAQNLARLGLLGQVGGLQQALQQQGIQAARGEFERALAYGPQQLGLLQAGTGTPLTSTTTSTRDRGIPLEGTSFGNLVSGIGTAYGALFGGSDKRMKKDIKFLGKEKGHNIYSWNWNDKAKSIGWDKYPTIGVMAQEVMKYMPEAVVKDENGYLLVNYGELANA